MKNSTTKRPNIILLVGEDTGLHLGCYGDTYARTPNLDRLAASGIRFTNAISTAPVSAPSRSSIITGQYSWSIGSHHMRSTLLTPPRLFTHELRDAGYYVNWNTKTDFNFQPPADFADSTSDWVNDLRQGTLPDKPFFLYRNFGVTHESTMWHGPVGEKGDTGASAERMKLAPSLLPEHRHDPAKAYVPPYLPDDPQTRQSIAWYYDALSMQDAQIGQVLDALEQSPYADNTIVIYMTDHGRGLAREKRWCYEAGLHLPLIVAAPHMPGRFEPSLRHDVINWVDIAPTILSLTGVPLPEQYQGVAQLGEARGPERAFAFAGRDRMDEAYDRVRAVRDRHWHYIRNFYPQLPYAQRNLYMEYMPTTLVLRQWNLEGRLSPAQKLWMSERKPAEELYDVVADPCMIHNLAADPAHSATLKRMRAALDEHMAKVDDKGATSERKLVARNLVKDRLDEYHARVEPLRPEWRIGLERTIVEMEEVPAN